MRTLGTWAPAVCLWLVAVEGGAAGPAVEYHPEDRVAHVRAALRAVRDTAPADLENARAYVASMERGACNSASERLRVECLMTAARRYCRRKRAPARETCAQVLDVAASNALNERTIIGTSRRFELMRRERDVRAALRREAERIHAGWALDFHLSGGGARCAGGDADCLAVDIDDFCLRAGDSYGQSWQACVAALVWTLGAGVPQEPAPQRLAGGEP